MQKWEINSSGAFVFVLSFFFVSSLVGRKVKKKETFHKMESYIKMGIFFWDKYLNLIKKITHKASFKMKR